MTSNEILHHLSRHTLSHHTIPATSHHHCIFHITLLHTTCQFHATSCQTFNVATHIASDHHILRHLTSITPQSATYHHFTPQHLEAQDIPHHTATVQVSHHSHPQLPHDTHIQHRSTFHTTPYSTSHYTTITS